MGHFKRLVFPLLLLLLTIRVFTCLQQTYLQRHILDYFLILQMIRLYKILSTLQRD